MAIQRFSVPTDSPKSFAILRQGRLALAGHININLAELRPISRGRGQHPSTSTSSVGQGVNKTGGSPHVKIQARLPDPRGAWSDDYGL